MTRRTAITDVRNDHALGARNRTAEKHTAKDPLDRSMPILLDLNMMLEAG
jgi:hypothetical protein